MKNGNGNGDGRNKTLPPPQVQVQPIQTLLTGCAISVMPTSDGGKQIVMTHPLGQVFIVPLTAEGAREVAGALTGIAIERAMPPLN